MDAETEAAPLILPAPVYNLCMGDGCKLPPETIKAVDDFLVPASFRRKGTHEASLLYSIGMYVERIDKKRASCNCIMSI